MVKRSKETTPRDTSARETEWMDRRKFLMNAGKYSAAAAGLIAGSSALFNACSETNGDDDDENENGLPDEYREQAAVTNMEGDNTQDLSEGGARIYQFTVEEEGDYQLSISEESTGIVSVHLSLFDDDGELIWSDDAYLGATWTDGWDGLEPGTYYLVIESDTDGATLVFSVSRLDGDDSDTEGDTDSEWSDYSDWSDASEWSDAAEWVDSTWDNTWSDSSGWKDAGTGTWVAHSDTWYNGEWDDGWLNYGY